MTHTIAETVSPRASAPAPARPLHWLRAWRALRLLIADPERTDQVVEFLNAVGGSDARTFGRFRIHPEGRRLLAERPSLLATLADLDRLRGLPPGTLGRAYADFMSGEHLDPDGVVREFRAAEWDESDADRSWFFERVDVMHDLWHVLTGYGRDAAGEAANLAFTHAQLPGRGIALLILAAIAIGPKDLDLSWPRYLRRAWQRGRRATWLPVVRYEEILEQPLVDVRRRLGIEPPEVAHPDGIVVDTATNRAHARNP